MLWICYTLILNSWKFLFLVMVWNSVKTTILLAGLAGVFIGMGRMFGGQTGMFIGLGLALVLNFSAFWFSDKVVLKMHNAKEVYSGELFELVADLARRAKMPMPKVFLIEAASPNAFATGRSPKHASVACTRSLMDLLSFEELQGVMAHELSHVKNRDTLIQTIAVTIASAVAFVAEMMQWMAIFGLGGSSEEGNDSGSIVGMIALMILAPLVASLIQLAISRQREFMADRGAARILRTGIPLISALEKLEVAASSGFKTDVVRSSVSSLYIVNPFRSSSLAALFSTHPKTSDRVAVLRKLKFNR